LIYRIDNISYSFTNNDGIIDIKKINTNGNYAFHYDESNKFTAQITDTQFSKGLTFDPKNISIFHCENSTCSRISGYLKYNNSVVLNCSTTTCGKIETSIDCTSGTKVGTPFCDSSSNFKICLNIGDATKNNYIAKEIPNGPKTYFFSLNKSANLNIRSILPILMAI